MGQGVSFPAGAAWGAKRREFLFLLVLATLPLLVYLPTLGHELIWDSKPIILENDLLKEPFSLSAPFRSGYWATTSQRADGGYDYYRPVTMLSFMGDKAFWGLTPFRLRLTNLLLFIASLFVLYFFLLRLSSVPWIPQAAVLLYGLFPLHLDNITWVVGRCDLLMLFFGTLSLFLFDRFLDKRAPSWCLLALACYSLALFSKEAALFFLPLYPLFELIRRRRLSFPVFLFLLASAGFWLAKSLVIGRAGFPLTLFPTFWGNARSVLGVLGYYARSLAFPFRFDMFLPVNAVVTAFYMVPGALFALFLLLVPICLRKDGELLHAWLWIAPFLGGYLLMVFAPIYPFSISTRYMLVPAIGWTWLAARWIGKLPGRQRNGLLVMVLLLFGGAVLADARRYRSELSFWQGALRGCPGDSFFLHKTAQQLLERGDYIGSESLLRRALSSPLNSATAASVALDLAELTFRQARYPESLSWLSQAGSLPLKGTQAQNRLFQILRLRLARGELAAAEQAIREIRRLQPAARLSEVELYLAFAEWSKARSLVASRPGSEKSRARDEIDRLENTFRMLPLRERARFFQQYGNFAFAWELLRQEPPAAFADRLLQARAALLAGQEEEGERLLADLAVRGGADFRLLNSLGNLLWELHRAGEALPYYQRSLRQNPLQPALRQRIDWIGERLQTAGSPAPVVKK
jgi:tetratricopeptide (TPR) repeat protein